MYKLHAEYEFPGAKGLFLTGGVQYNGPQYADSLNTQTMPGYTTGDLGTRYGRSLMGRFVTFRINAANLTNKAYWLSGEIGAPRTVSGSMEVSLFRGK